MEVHSVEAGSIVMANNLNNYTAQYIYAFPGFTVIQTSIVLS